MDFSSIKELYIPEGKVKMITFPDGSSYLFGPEPYKDQYLTFESLEDNNVIGWKKSSSDAPTGTIQYSTDKTTWTSVTPDTTGVTLATLNTGDKLYLKGDNDAYGNFPSNTNRWINFTSTKTFNMYGNIMSLLNSTNFKTMTTLPPTTRIFSNIFSGTKVVDASNLILPATAVTFVGYYCMFKNCTELTTPPVLPATSLNMYCYNSMFEGCSKLATAPVLPATSLANYCYQSMFKGCSKLATLPVLPATSLANYCYTSMFKGCTSLTSIPSNYLPATNISNSAYYGMFEGCTNLTTVPNNLLPATTLNIKCYFSMFSGCTSLTSVPSLPATTLISGCYYLMFYNCTSLTAAPSLPATTLAQNCYRGMFQNCSNITTAPELPATTLVDACYRSMFYGCSKLNYIKMLATDISATECLYYWTSGVAVSGTFVKDANTTMSTGYSGIPSGWTVQNIDNTVKDNASITLYDNYEKGRTNTQYNKIHTLSTGDNYTRYGSDTNAWYYQKGKYISIGTNYSYMSVNTTFKMNLVITGLTEFKLYLYNPDNVNISVLNKINDDTKLAWGDYSSSNEHVQVYVTSGGKEYTYNNLNPNSKYTIAINSKCGPSSSLYTQIIIPSTYPSVSIQYAYFNQSTDYTEIYG